MRGRSSRCAGAARSAGCVSQDHSRTGPGRRPRVLPTHTVDARRQRTARCMWLHQRLCGHHRHWHRGEQIPTLHATRNSNCQPLLGNQMLARSTIPCVCVGVGAVQRVFCNMLSDRHLKIHLFAGRKRRIAEIGAYNMESVHTVVQCSRPPWILSIPCGLLVEIRSSEIKTILVNYNLKKI